MFDSTSHTIDCANPVNWSHPALCAGRRPVGWWMCIPGLMGGGKWHDLMSPPDLTIGNHGTLSGMAQGSTSGWCPADRPGGFGGCRFDGTNDEVLTPTIALSGPFTISWSMRTTRIGAIANYRKLLGADYGTLGSGIFIRVGTTHLYFETASPTTFTDTNVTDGLWHRCHFTRDLSNNLTCYVDGRASSIASTLSGATPNFRGICGPANPGEHADVSMDDIQIHGRCFGREEIRDNCLLTLLGYPGVLNRLPVFSAISSTSVIFRRNLFNRAGSRGVI